MNELGTILYVALGLFVGFLLVLLKEAQNRVDGLREDWQEAADRHKKESSAWNQAVVDLREKLENERSQYRTQFDFPVNVPDMSRDDRIAFSAFMESPLGKLILLRLRATCVNMALAAGENKQFCGARASEAHGYSECVRQLQSLSAVPTESDNTPSGQEGEVGELVNKFSP